MARSRVGVALLIAAALAGGCDYTVDEGSFGGLEIGTTKEQVLDALESKGVRDVLPIVDRALTASYGQVQALDELNEQDGLCLYSSSGLARIGFDDSDLIGYLQFAPNNALADEIKIGARREDFMLIAARLARSDTGFSLFNCIPDTGWIRITGAGDDGKLSRFDVWSFHEPNSYSRAELRFVDGKLERIDYHWRPFEE